MESSPWRRHGATAGAEDDAPIIFSDIVVRHGTTYTYHCIASPLHHHPSPHKPHGEPATPASSAGVHSPWPPSWFPNLGGRRVEPLPITKNYKRMCTCTGHSLVMSSRLGLGMPVLAHRVRHALMARPCHGEPHFGHSEPVEVTPPPRQDSPRRGHAPHQPTLVEMPRAAGHVRDAGAAVCPWHHRAKAVPINLGHLAGQGGVDDIRCDPASLAT